MKVRSIQRPLFMLLPILLLALALLALTVACGAESDEAPSPDPSTSEQRQDAEEPSSQKEEEQTDKDDASDKADEEKQTKDKPEDPEPTPVPTKDTGILKRLTGGDSGGDSFASDVLALLPASETLRELTAYDVRSILASEEVREPLVKEIEESFTYLGGHCISLDQVETIVTPDNWNIFIKGNFSLADLRALLDGDGYVNETYREHEIWTASRGTVLEYGGYQSVAIFEEQHAVLMGGDTQVRQVLKDLNRGNESFLEVDSQLRQVFEKSRNGLKVKLDTLCSGENCQVFVVAMVTAASNEDYAADIELVVLTDSDDSAEAVKDKTRASVQKEFGGIEILDASHEADDEFVYVRATIDEESVGEWQRYRFPLKLVYKPGGFLQQGAAPASPSGGELPQRECPPGN